MEVMLLVGDLMRLDDRPFVSMRMLVLPMSKCARRLSGTGEDWCHSDADRLIEKARFTRRNARKCRYLEEIDKDTLFNCIVSLVE